MRGWIVLAMVTVAVVGAITAFRSAKTAQDAAILSQRLAEGELLELAMLQSVESEELARTALCDRHAVLLRQGGLLMNAAAAAQKGDEGPENADWLEMRAEEEFAADRAISPVLRQFRGPGGGPPCPSPQDVKPGPPDLAQAKLQLEVVGRLARLGIDPRWCGPGCETGAGDGLGAAARVHESAIGSDGEPPRPAAMWGRLQRRIENMHERERSLAFAVVSFTVALAFFTFADAAIRRQRPWVKWAWFGAGVALAAATFFVIVFCLDPEGWRWLLAGLIGTPLFGLLLWQAFDVLERKGWIHPRADAGHVHPDAITADTSAIPAPVLPHESNGRLTTFVVIALAVTVVFSALSALGYSKADTKADEMALLARVHAAEMAKHSDFLGRTQERIGRLAANLECRARLAAIDQRLDRFHRDGFHADEDERDTKRLRDDTVCNRGWDKDVDDPTIGADADPNFPQKIVRWAGRIETPAAVGEPPQLAEFNMWQSFGMRDAAATHSLASRRTATRFLATLTLFAIALYMLGQALGMGRHRSAYVLTASGVLFAVVGFGLWVAFADLARDAESPPDECAAKEPDLRKERAEPWARAAYDYAVGMSFLKIQADADQARKYLNCAVIQRPDFADAARRLAFAESLSGSADSDDAYMRVYQPDKLPVILAAESVALRLLKKDELPLSAWFLNFYAYHNLLDALANKHDQELDISIDAANEAIRVAESQGRAGEANCSSACRFNLGLALLARGRIADARNAYVEGVRALDNRRSQERVVGALTGLEILAGMRCGPSMRPDDEAAGCARKLGVDEMKALMVRGPASEGLTNAGASENFVLSASEGRLTASGRNIAKEDLWLVWYQWEPSWNSWRALQSLSGPIDDKPNRDGALTVRPSDPYNYASAKRCLGSAKYRAELYANGVLLASKLLEPKRDSFTRKRSGIAVVFDPSAGAGDIDLVHNAPSTAGSDSSSARQAPASTWKKLFDLNVQVCLPSGWTLARRGSTDGLMRSLDTADGKPGAFLFTYYEPRRLRDAREDGELVNCARETLLSAGLIAGDEALQRFDPQNLSSPSGSPALLYKLWHTDEGEAHIIIARSDVHLEADQFSQMLQSAETIEEETGGSLE